MNSLTHKIKSYFRNFNFKVAIKTFLYDCFVMPIYFLTHPIKGFDEFKREKTSKTYVAIFYLIMMIVTQIVMFNGSGFLINKNSPDDFNLLLTISLILFPVLLVTVGNWASTALMDGKGTMSDIFKIICYSFYPYVWLGLIGTILSNYITFDEIVFYNFIMTIGATLTGYMMFFGLMGIHEYGLLKNILMILFTILAIAVILFIMLLFLSLIQQVYSFLASIFEEFSMRFL